MTDKEYRSAEGISHSQLVKLKDSPEKFKYLQDHPEEPTEALIFGQAFHAAALQPKIFVSEYAFAPECDRRTKTGKETWDNFLKESKGKTILSNNVFAKIEEMHKKLFLNKLVSKLFYGVHEKEFFWNDKDTGERCKCRVDALTVIANRKIIVDLKTTDNAETEAFMRNALKYGYHTQAAMYCDGVKANVGEECDFVFVAIEKKPPYAVNILQADDLFIQYGRDEYKQLLRTYHYCKTNDNWYGYNGKDDTINVLGLPLWLAKEVESLYGV